MEAQAGGKVGLAYGPVLADMNAEGKRSLEWDLNDWRWDGDLLLATPYSPVRSQCRSRQLFPARPETSLSINIPECSTSGFDVLNQDDGRGRKELEKRRTLKLKLGGQSYEMPDEEADKLEETSGKKIKVCGGSMSRPVCQVEDCRADLSQAKDYHRRHKVCEIHSKASQAMVGSVMQRFCQQCSGFHVLQEFDEGKRSCRRRLAGHNKRRRKTHPETSVNMVSTNDGNSSSYLLVSLLRILTNLQSSSTDQKKDQDLLSRLLENLASLGGTANANNTSGLAQHCEDSQDVGMSTAPNKDHVRDDQSHVEPPSVQTLNVVSSTCMQQAVSSMLPKVGPASDVAGRENGTGTTQKKNGLTNIDLNSVYDESQDLVNDREKPLSSLDRSDRLQDVHKSSPPQTSGNSDSTSTRSPSSSSGSESQGRTDRIIFKLFGKDPNDLPQFLRRQILDWLSHSPTNIEGYIRPGCVVLTIYLRLYKSSWQELSCNLGSSLRGLLDMSDDTFWRTGWIYTRVQNRVAFICNGQVVLDTTFPNETYTTSQISSISPLAVSASQRVQFIVRGSNLSRSTSRLLCGIEGKYLAQESSNSLPEDDNGLIEHDDTSCLRLSCAIPDVIGRGFIDIVEDCGFSGSSFPFIVAEPDVCAEIRTLERAVVATDGANETEETYEKIDARNQALDFLNEMGWLLHISGMRIRSTDANISQDLFPFERVKCLLDFSVNRDWCAVVKKLLDVVFDGIVDPGKHPSVRLALLEMGLLHQAVRRNNKCMVESLIRYIPHSRSYQLDSARAEASQEKQGIPTGSFLFRPDNVDPGGLTPLHIAASSHGCENVLEALIDDPGMIGIGAWRNARDDTGLTPNDYACLRGHYSYIYLVQRKINKLSSPAHVVVDIPPTLSSNKPNQKLEPSDISIFQMEKLRPKPMLSSCSRCERKLNYGYTRTALTCRPLMLSMLAIVAVCVCAALLFKSSPEVYVLKPFSWESLKYGVM